MAEKKLWEGKWKGKLTKDNFLIMVLLGILLLVIAWPVKKEEKEKMSQSGQWDSKNAILDLSENGDAGIQSLDSSLSIAAPEYAAYLEEALEQLLSTMDGVGKVRVMVTLEDGGETLVEKDLVSRRGGSTEVDSAGGSRNTTDISEEESTVFSGQGSAQGPFIRQVKYPKVMGVAVSAEGGGNAATVQKITRAIQALFGIEAHKIIIVKMISE